MYFRLDPIVILVQLMSSFSYIKIDEFNSQEGSLSAPIDEDVEILGKVWKVIVDTPVKAAKVQVKKRIVREFCRIAQEIVILPSANESAPVLQFFLKFFTSVMHNKTVFIYLTI